MTKYSSTLRDLIGRAEGLDVDKTKSWGFTLDFETLKRVLGCPLDYCWNDFNRYVLRKAVAEINTHHGDYFIDYQAIRSTFKPYKANYDKLVLFALRPRSLVYTNYDVLNGSTFVFKPFLPY